jgi:hypothetical protein
MLLRNGLPVSLLALLGALALTGTIAAGASAPGVPVHVVVADPGTIRVSGSQAGARQLQAVLYARFGPDLPGVFLSRRPLPTDADGNFDATFPIAPAYFTGAIITVTVQTSAAVAIGRGSITIVDPTDIVTDRH